jgi:hypothetical protein
MSAHLNAREFAIQHTRNTHCVPLPVQRIHCSFGAARSRRVAIQHTVASILRCNGPRSCIGLCHISSHSSAPIRDRRRDKIPISSQPTRTEIGSATPASVLTRINCAHLICAAPGLGTQSRAIQWEVARQRAAGLNSGRDRRACLVPPDLTRSRLSAECRAQGTTARKRETNACLGLSAIHLKTRIARRLRNIVNGTQAN